MSIPYHLVEPFVTVEPMISRTHVAGHERKHETLPEPAALTQGT